MIGAFAHLCGRIGRHYDDRLCKEMTPAQMPEGLYDDFCASFA